MNPWSFLIVIQMTLILTPTITRADPVKRGRPICEGLGCQGSDFKDATSSISEHHEEQFISAQEKSFIGDFVERIKARTGGKSPSQVREKRKSNELAFVRNLIKAESEPSGNLPDYYRGLDRSDIKASERSVYTSPTGTIKLKEIKTGDVIQAIIEQQIKASPGVPTPIRAIALSGPFRGAVFLGEAILDRELKRILFSFHRLRIRGREETYTLKASGLSPGGSVGLEGQYVSQSGKFFLGELASATAIGVVDANINRTQTNFGTYIQEPSLANVGKQGTITALSRTADRFAEGARNAPEYTELPGFQEIQIIIQDDPTES